MEQGVTPPDTGYVSKPQRRDVHKGGDGNDRLNAHDGVNDNDTLHGGGGRDNCAADPGDTVDGCP